MWTFDSLYFLELRIPNLQNIDTRIMGLRDQIEQNMDHFKYEISFIIPLERMKWLNPCDRAAIFSYRTLY